MSRFRSAKGYVCLVGVFAVIGTLMIFPKFTTGQSSIPIPMRSQWSPDVRLTSDKADSLLSFNFARSIAADDAGRVHVVWYDTRDGNSQVYYKRSTDGGETWEQDVRLSQDSAWREHPAIAVSGNHVYVVWHDSRNDGLDVYFKFSWDGGSTWSGEVPLTSDGSSIFAAIAAQGENVQVIWSSYQDGAQSEIYTSHSTDAGLSWAAAIRISDIPYNSWTPAIAISGQQVYASWVDTADDNEEEYFRRSMDGGATWGPIQRLTDNRASSWAPAIIASGETVHLVWFDQQDSPVLPLDAEEKLDAVMRLLDLPVEPAPVGIVVTNPELAAQRRATEKYQLIQSSVLSWIGKGGDVLKLQAILLQFETLGRQGASYLEKERKLNEAMVLMGLSYLPGPTDDLPKVHYLEALNIRLQDKLKQVQAAAPAWIQQGGNWSQLEAMLREFQQAFSLASAEWDVYYRRSTDGGQTWEPIRRLTNAPMPSLRPSIAASGNELHLVWYDYRDGNAEIYYKQSTDAGATWSADERLTFADGDSLQPAVTLGGNFIHVAWFDKRDGNSEIYYKRLRRASHIRILPGR